MSETIPIIVTRSKQLLSLIKLHLVIRDYFETRPSGILKRTKQRITVSMLKLFTCSFFLILAACSKKVESIKPETSAISESVYASGVIKSNNQYEAYLTVSGIIDQVFVKEGDVVKKGAPILSVANQAQRLNRENAALSAQIADYNANQGKLNDAKLFIELSKNSLMNDSALYFRQKAIWDNQYGSKAELEQRALAYQQSKTNYYSSLLKYEDLKRQLNYNSAQTKKTLLISSKTEKDYTLRSDIEGIVYKLLKYKGEIVSPQSALAIIGSSSEFILEMQIDERDILKVRKDQAVFVSMDSYKGKVFEAKVSRILPMMNQRSNTFLVEAVFVEKPEILYPNLTFEASILLQKKEKALLVPRNYVKNDSILTLKDGTTITVKTGLRDYQKIEITSGLQESDELIKPK